MKVVQSILLVLLAGSFAACDKLPIPDPNRAAMQKEQDGKAVIIRPTVPLKIGRLDQKPQQLLKLHDHGIECGLAKFHEIMQLYRK